MQLSISVVTPSFNQGRFLERTIQSVLSQDVPTLEYVVMDGGSNDESVAVLRHHESRLRWVSEKDRGQAHAVNKGLAVTTGEVIGWLNSDDCYLQGALRTVVDYFHQHPQIDVVYGEAQFIDQHNRVMGSYPTESWNARRLRSFCFLCQPAVFFRRRVVDRCGALDEKLHYCMDYEYWLRLTDQGCRFGYIPQSLAASRLYPATKTLGCRRKVHVEINDMLLHKHGSVSGHWLLNYSCAVLSETGPALLRPMTLAAGLLPVLTYATWRWRQGFGREWGQDVVAALGEKASHLRRPRHPRVS